MKTLKYILITIIVLLLIGLTYTLTKGTDVNGFFSSDVSDVCKKNKPTLDTSVRKSQAWIQDCVASIKHNKAEHTRITNLAKDENIKADEKREVMVMTIMDLGLSVSQELIEEAGLVFPEVQQEPQRDSDPITDKVAGVQL